MNAVAKFVLALAATQTVVSAIFWYAVLTNPSWDVASFDFQFYGGILTAVLAVAFLVWGVLLLRQKETPAELVAQGPK